MTNANALVSNNKYCLAKPGAQYLVYLPNGGATQLDLTGADGDFTLYWFNPRSGGPLVEGQQLRGGDKADLGRAPADVTEDWVALVRRQ